MPRYFVHTLGCKLNQADSAVAEGLLRAHGWERCADPADADLVVLNTCTVTSRADAEARRLARRFRRENPGARLVALGCYAEREPGALARLGVFDAIVGHRDRERMLAEALLGHPPRVPWSALPAFADRTRAWLKVQEGCDLACTYCAVRLVRGPSRSVPAEMILQRLQELAARGVREVGLTGVNTGDWGRDLDPPRELADLLEAIVARDLPLRVRLNSLEPRTVTPRILELMAAEPRKLVPHLQVPLQSGSDRVLARMGRNYRSRLYREVIEGAAATVPDICLGADVITGFPGETEDDHRATAELLADLPLGYLHVFSFSPRPGTRAAALPDRVPPHVIRDRTSHLRELAARLRRRFRERMLGRTLEVLSLHAHAEDGSTRTLTGNYIEVLVPGVAPGQLLPVRLVSLLPDGERMRGEPAAA